MGATQRLRQGFRALFAFTVEADLGLAQQYLSPAQLALFQSMSHSEQLHCLNVLQDLLDQQEPVSSDLAAAALLHDVGKSRYKLAVWQRTYAVLLRKLSPGQYQRLSQQKQITWRNAGCVIAEYHAQWGAELAKQTNSSDVVVWLIEHHQDDASQWLDHPNYPLLVRLQAVDNEN